MFKKYEKVKRLDNDETENILNGTCYIFEKLDGCFTYDTLLLTDKGHLKIGEIVNKKLNIKVLTYNFNKKEYEYSDILNYYKTETNKNDFLKVFLSTTNSNSRIKCTKSHLILTKKGWKKAEDLIEGDDICYFEENKNIISTTKYLKTMCYNLDIKYKYDIETKNHNYILANRVIVHNSNASIWFDEKIRFGTRNNEITGFRGLELYINDNYEKLYNFFQEFPNYRLFGEWLVKHTINYKPEQYQKLYIFDVFDGEKFLNYEEYFPILDKYNLLYIKCFCIILNPTIKHLEEYVGKSNLIEFGEGIVIKNYDFINKYGRNCYAKIVTEKFKEINHSIMGSNKYDNIEVKIISQFLTKARIEKIVNKIIDENGVISIKDSQRVIGMSYHDLVTEEMWNIIKKFKRIKIDFNNLNRICSSVTMNYFQEILLERVKHANI